MALDLNKFLRDCVSVAQEKAEEKLKGHGYTTAFIRKSGTVAGIRRGRDIIVYSAIGAVLFLVCLVLFAPLSPFLVILYIYVIVKILRETKDTKKAIDLEERVAIADVPLPFDNTPPKTVLKGRHRPWKSSRRRS